MLACAHVTDAGLSRSLKLPQATALVVGTILGSAVFVQASELTEHVPIEDYPALRAALGTLDREVRVSVDDAGAGFASFRHILEPAGSTCSSERPTHRLPVSSGAGRCSG